jgi:histidine racemase
MCNKKRKRKRTVLVLFPLRLRHFVQLKFVKMNPSGNTTVLILDPPSRDLYAALAARLMIPTSLSAEQVGFVERPTLSGAMGRLQMMGGEFCGNASRAYAAWLADRSPEGQQGEWLPIEVSGHGGLLKAHVLPREIRRKRLYSVSIPMPGPKSISPLQLRGPGGAYTIVRFEGIVHVIAWDQPGSEDQFRAIQTEVERSLGEIDCLGVMFFQKGTHFLRPAVYVGKVGTLVWESSCGSGSVAVAAALAQRDQTSITALDLVQPGGTLQVDVAWKGGAMECRISGDVSIEAEGTVYVDVEGRTGQ